ncbi:MAG: 2-amino-4-hydroxy-6-hydroxymethyldihydropteridine diphosphokinase [Candidatus Omnitrophota bacterium]
MDVYIGIGSNLGNRLENINKAIEFLKEDPRIEIVKISSIIETKPSGGPVQGDYLNGVLKIKTGLAAVKLLLVLQGIERTLGRVRTVRNGPRTIDLDILLYGNEEINEVGLKIPHPRMFDRDFVMKPLLEIEPDILKRFGK